MHSATPRLGFRRLAPARPYTVALKNVHGAKWLRLCCRREREPVKRWDYESAKARQLRRRAKPAVSCLARSDHRPQQAPMPPRRTARSSRVRDRCIDDHPTTRLRRLPQPRVRRSIRAISDSWFQGLMFPDPGIRIFAAEAPLVAASRGGKDAGDGPPRQRRFGGEALNDVRRLQQIELLLGYRHEINEFRGAHHPALCADGKYAKGTSRSISLGVVRCRDEYPIDLRGRPRAHRWHREWRDGRRSRALE